MTPAHSVNKNAEPKHDTGDWNPCNAQAIEIE
jgi:hypothetical protein